MRLIAFFIVHFSFLLSSAQPLLWDMGPLLAAGRGEDAALREATLRRAEGILGQEPLSVVTPPKRFVTDQHNYASLSIYFWPDSTDERLPYVSRDGHRNPEADRYDGPKIAQLSHRLRTLAQAYYLARDPRHHYAFARQLSVWFTDSATRMNPQFDYAQIVPNRNGNRGNPWGIIEAYAFVDIIEAIRLMESLTPLDPQLHDGLTHWFEQFAQWLRQSELGRKEAAAKNNHGIAYDVILLSMALYTGDQATAQALADSFPLRLQAQIRPDGSQPAELARNNAFNYSVYNLTHILDFCCIQQSLGNPFYSQHRAPIDTAFKFLWQYAPQPDTFPYKELKDWDSVVGYLRQQTERLQRLRENEE